MSKDIVAEIFKYSDKIKNDRTYVDAYLHMRSEEAELHEEIQAAMQNNKSGDDGVVGEAIDIILCALDIIRLYDNNITPEEVTKYAIKKAEKWKEKYHQGK